MLQGTNANEGRLFEPGFFPGALVFPGVSAANIVAAGGPASFGLQVPNGLCATPPFVGQPAHCTYAQEIVFFMQTLVTATPSNNGPTAPFTQAVVVASIAAAGEYPIANFHNSVPQTTGTIPGLNNNFGGGNVDEALSQIFTDFVFACNGFDSNSDLSGRTRVFATSSMIQMPRTRPASQVRGRMAQASRRLRSTRLNSSTSSTSARRSPPRKRRWRPI